jgi:hypothetical protein
LRSTLHRRNQQHIARVAQMDPQQPSPSSAAASSTAAAAAAAAGGQAAQKKNNLIPVDDPSLLSSSINSNSTYYVPPQRPPPSSSSPSRPTSPVDLLTSFVSDLATAAATAATNAINASAGANAGTSARPLVPEVDLNAVLGQMLGTDDRSGSTLAGSLAADDGPPRLFTPNLPELRGPNGVARDAAALPLMFYLPGEKHARVLHMMLSFC